MDKMTKCDFRWIRTQPEARMLRKNCQNGSRCRGAEIILERQNQLFHSLKQFPFRKLTLSTVLLRCPDTVDSLRCQPGGSVSLTRDQIGGHERRAQIPPGCGTKSV